MATLAVFSSKGGVGKTSLAVNLAWASASLSRRRTLLWDLDAQAAASFVLAPDRLAGEEARAVIERDVEPDDLILPTGIDGLDLLPADASLRTLDLLFDGIGAKKRLKRITDMLAKRYDRIVVDCPPGLGVTADQVIRGASLILVPMIPSALSVRAATELRDHLAGRKGAPPVLPVFNMVDRRRAAHRDALAASPGQPAIPMASAIEQMADRHAPLSVYAPRTAAAAATAELWVAVERRLAEESGVTRSAPMLAIVAGLSAMAATAVPPKRQPHSIILFVADGLRGGIVNADTAPAMARLRAEGVAFPNSHAVFPTFTTANASALATGHQLGDTGDFSNTIYTAHPTAAANGSVVPFLENDAVLGEVDGRFDGNYLGEETILEAARKAGYGTAAIGKLGPALIQDHRARDGAATIILDDSTGTPTGIPLAPEIAAALTAAGLPLATPPRGDNGLSGSATVPGTTVPNRTQQDYFVEATARAILPRFGASGRPFVMVFWSRDPDGTQHNQGDSLDRLTPGINGPTSLAAIRNADDDLARLRAALDRLGLTATTDIIVTSDHGFSTISKESRTSPAAHVAYKGVPTDHLPPGFLALDLAAALHLPLFDPDTNNAPVTPGTFPVKGSGLLGDAPDRPRLVVAANGGSDLLYLPTHDRTLARRIVSALLAQDYVEGVFVDDALGPIAGALPLSAINLAGAAVTPTPSIVVAFRTWTTGCAIPTNCQVEIADSTLQQGQGMHGSFGRGDTFNFTAAIGPDFKRRFIDPAPVGNADIGRTMAHLLGLDIRPRGTLLGRPLTEAMPGGTIPVFRRHVLRSPPDAAGRRTSIGFQSVGRVRYLDRIER